VNFRNDSLVYFIASGNSDEVIPLTIVKRIVTKNNLCAFDGDFYNFYDQNFATSQILRNKEQKIERNNETTVGRTDYHERTSKALERIAFVQEYFMFYSVTVTIIALFVLVR